MIARLRAFGHFWYDFIVGDDWRVAVGVVCALGITYGVARTGVPAWWVMPAAVVLLVTGALWTAVRRG